jgi:TrmH family RNA methyltransferase
MARAPATEGLCWVALEAIHSPGNLGTILRTCDAVGAAGVILLGEAADPYDPATVRASMGSLFAQRLVRATPAELLAWKQRHGCRLIGTSPAGTVDYRELIYRPPMVLFMGSERHGLPAVHQTLCDEMVRIPMVGAADSLNLAVATSVMLYEVFGRRQA